MAQLACPSSILKLTQSPSLEFGHQLNLPSHLCFADGTPQHLTWGTIQLGNSPGILALLGTSRKQSAAALFVLRQMQEDTLCPAAQWPGLRQHLHASYASRSFLSSYSLSHQDTSVPQGAHARLASVYQDTEGQCAQRSVQDNSSQ